MATNRFSPKIISNVATNAARAHGRSASDHCMGSARTGTVCEAGRTSESCDVVAAAKARGETGSAITTRICGAEHCGQKATPSSTRCPHL